MLLQRIIITYTTIHVSTNVRVKKVKRVTTVKKIAKRVKKTATTAKKVKMTVTIAKKVTVTEEIRTSNGDSIINLCTETPCTITIPT